MNEDDLKKLLRIYNLKPNFTYGQNFLIDDTVLEDIVDAAHISAGDAVVEIGPGIGNLTRRLLETGAYVLSIEKDEKFLPILKTIKKEFKENFRFEIADALKFDYIKGFRVQGSGLNWAVPSPLHPQPYKVAANIPYYITGKILRLLLSSKLKPSSITLLTQKEVAENIIAKAGNLNVLAISVQIFGQAKIIRNVPSRAFYPAPKVHSAILQIVPYEKPKYAIANEKNFFRIVKACFLGKRKQIHNTLVNNLRLDKKNVLEILGALKIKPEARPQELTIEQWIDLEKLITNYS